MVANNGNRETKNFTKQSFVIGAQRGPDDQRLLSSYCKRNTKAGGELSVNSRTYITMQFRYTESIIHLENHPSSRRSVVSIPACALDSFAFLTMEGRDDVPGDNSDHLLGGNGQEVIAGLANASQHSQLYVGQQDGVTGRGHIFYPSCKKISRRPSASWI